MTTPRKSVAYTARRPLDAYDFTWLSTELQNVQRSIPILTIRTTTTNDTQQPNDGTVKVDTTAGNKTFTLLSPLTAPLSPITVKNVGANVLTIVATVDGAVNPTLALNASYTMQADGAVWAIL